MPTQLYTDYPITELGDTPGVEAPIRACSVVEYHGFTYVTILCEGVEKEIKRGYVYAEPGRCGDVSPAQIGVCKRMTNFVVVTDQHWALKAGGPSWRVVAMVPDGTVALTGPGPCRMTKYISVDELERDYELVQIEPGDDGQKIAFVSEDGREWTVADFESAFRRWENS